MRNKFSNPSNTIIINATNIGKKFQGLGVYSFNIINELTRLSSNLNFIIYLNKSSEDWFRNIHFPENFELRWTTSLISPDMNFKGHLLRLFYSNFLSLRYGKFHIFNTSQMEINFFRTRQIVTVHDIIPLLFRKFHRKQYFFFKLLLNYGLKKANYIITPSNHSKKMLREIYNLPDNRIKVIHNGADSFFAGRNEQIASLPDKFILYLGRINKMKNLGNLLKAYNKIMHLIEYKLVVIGNDKKAFQKELDSIDCNFPENRVLFFENITPAQKDFVLSKASLFVFPSLYEGFGLPPIEAMAKGCPVIVSNNSSLLEVCADAAVYINPEDVDEIASTMYEVLSKEKLLKHLSIAGKNRARLFSWYLSGIMHLNTIESVVTYNQLPVEEKLLEIFSLIGNRKGIVNNAN
jgi:glycosyltransferase involved in cell wall biosynthesis